MILNLRCLTQTSINATRDLHCWRINFSWVPFGRFQSYNLSINAVSALLQDLKLEKEVGSLIISKIF